MRFRLLLPVVVAAFALWLPFAIAHANPHALWLAVPFLAANLLLAVSLLVTLVNNWTRTTPRDWVVAQGSEPDVAVIVPTSGETTAHVRGTIESVLNQDWPKERLIVLLSDDADSDLMRALAHQLAAAHAPARVHYVRPPRRGTPERKGDAKAGNLNAALDRLDELAPDTAFIETRDADDLVGDRRFLRRCVGQLAADAGRASCRRPRRPSSPAATPSTTSSRTSSAARCSPATPPTPSSRAVSGLVWRRTALDDIGGFPTWNLVEDLQSGVEALRRGWRGLYLPILGAVGQHAPEDLPNALQAARDVGGRHDPAAPVGRPARPLAAPARCTSPSSASSTCRASPPSSSSPARCWDWPRASTRCRRPTAGMRCTSGPSRSAIELQLAALGAGSALRGALAGPAAVGRPRARLRPGLRPRRPRWPATASPSTT